MREWCYQCDHNTKRTQPPRPEPTYEYIFFTLYGEQLHSDQHVLSFAVLIVSVSLAFERIF